MKNVFFFLSFLLFLLLGWDTRVKSETCPNRSNKQTIHFRSLLKFEDYFRVFGYLRFGNWIGHPYKLASCFSEQQFYRMQIYYRLLFWHSNCPKKRKAKKLFFLSFFRSVPSANIIHHSGVLCVWRYTLSDFFFSDCHQSPDWIHFSSLSHGMVALMVVLIRMRSSCTIFIFIEFYCKRWKSIMEMENKKKRRRKPKTIQLSLDNWK